MGFFKKIAGFLGFAHENKEEEENGDPNDNNGNSDENRRNRMNVDPIPTGPRKGFSVPVQVPVERPVVGPVLVPCNGDGGIQAIGNLIVREWHWNGQRFAPIKGLKWYAERLKIDEDGDVADEFIYEVSPETSHVKPDQPKPMPRFQVKSNVRHVKVRRQKLTSDGKFQHLVECHGGQLQWV